VKHRHRPVSETTTPFFGAVSDRENPKAHGNVCYVGRCSCGATRKTNVNRLWIERGPWIEPEE
jgi:hypothetical protein